VFIVTFSFGINVRVSKPIIENTIVYIDEPLEFCFEVKLEGGNEARHFKVKV
jgi:hypothetical protein